MSRTRAAISLRGVHRASAAFTMVELLIALLIASMVAASLYLLFTTNSRVFYLQERQAQAQAATRFALEQISADLKRAGFLATANDATDKRICPGGAVSGVTGLRVSDGAGVGTVFNPSANANIKPDEVRILANFKGSEKYRAKVADTTISLCASADTHPLCAGTPATAAEFNNLFRVNNLVRIEDTSGRYQFGLISAVNATSDPRTITLASAPSTQCGIHGGGAAEEVFVNPVWYLRYMIETPTNLGCSDTSQKNRVLIREWLDGSGNPLNPRDYWLMADNMVDLQVWADMESNAAPGDSTIPANSNPYNHRGNLDNNPTAGTDEVAKVNLNPELARTVHVAVSLRSPTAYSTYPFSTRPSGNLNSPDEYYGPITAYDLDAGAGGGSAPVQTLTLEAVLENFFLSWFY